MARLILFAPAQVALIDSTSAGASLINIIESLGVHQFPAALPALAIVTIWRRNEDEVDSAMQQRVELRDPESTVLAAIETPFYFDKMGHRILNHIGNVPLPHGGKYEFLVFVTRQGAVFPENPSSTFPVIIQQMAVMQVG